MDVTEQTGAANMGAYMTATHMGSATDGTNFYAYSELSCNKHVREGDDLAAINWFTFDRDAFHGGMISGSYRWDWRYGSDIEEDEPTFQEQHDALHPAEEESESKGSPLVVVSLLLGVGALAAAFLV